MVEYQEKLNILMLAWEFPPNLVGGLGRHVFWLTKSLADIECHVQIVTAMTEEVSNSSESCNRVKINRVPPLNAYEDDFLLWIGGLNIAIVDYVLSLPEVNQIEVIHTHDWLTSSAAITLAEILKIPLLATIHATEYGRNNGIYTDIQGFILRQETELVKKADKLIVCSQYMKREILQVLEAEEQKIQVIPNGMEPINDHVERSVSQLELPIYQDKKMVFSMGRMVTEKGFDILIEAANPLLKMYPELYFVVAGKGPLLNSYREQVHEMGLRDNFFFIGHINDQQRNHLLSLSDITVFPSRYEPFGIVALEAMSFGKPVVLSETGGFKELIEDGETGLYMIPGKTSSLIEKLIFLLKNPNLSAQMGEQGRKHAMNQYNWKNVAQKTKKIIEEIIN